jgi:hypothetical protein
MNFPKRVTLTVTPEDDERGRAAMEQPVAIPARVCLVAQAARRYFPEARFSVGPEYLDVYDRGGWASYRLSRRGRRIVADFDDDIRLSGPERIIITLEGWTER